MPQQSVALEAYKNNNRVYLAFSSRTVSEALPIKEFADEWQQPPGDGDSTWTRNRLDLGIWYRDWGVAYTQRFDYQLRYNNATTDLYYRDENNLPAPEGAVPVRLEISQLRAQGLKLQRRWRWESGYFLQTDLSLLSASDFQDGSLAGELGNENGFFSGTAALDYRYSEDLLLAHQFEQPEGDGLALDVSVGYSGARRSLMLEVQDLYSAIRWEQAPHTYGAFDTIDRDVAGEVQLNPLFSGKRLLEDFQQEMPRYGLVSYTEHIAGGADVKVDVEYFSGDLRYRPGMRWGDVPGNPYLGYEVEDGQWLLQLKDDRGFWHLQLGSDNRDWEKARSLTLAFGFSAPII
ncbi:hypothetical protein PVT68_13925 [Microbulbifer bruguierae]|uniref:Uncharacterized protein n=1 Tax=Microbulbifer bruguierae TaxID=3029061 RepID=A0ABY8NBT5_9GAMM|nr:hypothetical protein [Microbulbifer bruguierae]WGL15864.1 hypothetical protein PVT68_13925 [Microbulbifer bruguierae]